MLDEISSGSLPRGAPLSSQRDLARQLGVSVASLREALRSLQAMGIIEIRRGIGMFVTESSLSPISRNFDWAVLLETGQVEAIMEARYILEVGSARVAANRASDEQIEEIARAFEAMAEGFHRRDKKFRDDADIRFHLALAKATGNQLLVCFTETLLTALERFIKAVPLTAAGLARHGKVLEAIRERNPSKAEAAMRRLLGVTERHAQEAKAALSTTAPKPALATQGSMSLPRRNI